MKSEKFKVINYIRELLIMIDNELENFPKKELELKNRIKSNSYDILELSYEANNILDKNNKILILEKVLAKIKVIDFLLNLSYDKKLMSQKKYLKLANKIDDITKYTTGWINSISDSKKVI